LKYANTNDRSKLVRKTEISQLLRDSIESQLIKRSAKECESLLGFLLLAVSGTNQRDWTMAIIGIHATWHEEGKFSVPVY
jgi:hypothetical protein